MHLLLVEDSPSDVRLLKELMEEQGYHPEIHWVMNGHEALEFILRKGVHAKAPRPDAVLLDLGLPRISGYDILRQVKDSPDHRDIPIFILTTSRNPLDQEQCKTLGADEYISKPRSLSEYEALVHKLIADFHKIEHAA